MPARCKLNRGTSGPETLRVDSGGVIVTRGEGLEDTSIFGSRPMDTPPLPAVIDAISVLAGARFAGRVHSVSKAGPRIAESSLQWLHQSGFLTRTGLTECEVHFVRERSEKVEVCARLGITHFVDDRLSVLNEVPDVPFRYLFRGGLTAAQHARRINVPRNRRGGRLAEPAPPPHRRAAQLNARPDPTPCGIGEPSEQNRGGRCAMTTETHKAAFAAASDLVLTCASLVDRAAAGSIDAERVNRALTLHLARLIDALDRALTSTADPRDNTDVLVRFVRGSLEEVAELLATRRDLPTPEQTFLPSATRWLDDRVDHAQDTAELVALVLAWEAAPARRAARVVCFQEAERIAFAVDLGVTNDLLQRMVLAGLQAFGPQLVVALGHAYVREHRESRTFWDLVVLALDEVAAWSAATERTLLPDGFQVGSLEALLDLADDKVLSMWVVPRLPLHRLTRDQLRRLGELIQHRDRPLPIDEVGDDGELCTGSLESSYLWALEAKTTRLPGVDR